MVFELHRRLVDIGERPQRAAQLFSWMYRRGKLAEDFDAMEDVSKAFRDTLGAIATLEGDLELNPSRRRRTARGRFCTD